MACSSLWFGLHRHRRVLDLVGQYLHRTLDENCLYTTMTVGINLGCPLSPVMAVLYLEPLDRNSCTAARGSDEVMPTAGLCRVGVAEQCESRRISNFGGSVCRHNHKF